MKKINVYFLPLFAALVFLSSCKKEEAEPEYFPMPGTAAPAPDVAVTGVTFSQDVYEISLGHEFTLTATVAPENATNQTVFFTSSAPERVSVDGSVAKALRLYDPDDPADEDENVTITVTTADGDHKATCEIKVIIVPLTGVALSVPVVTLGVDEEFEMSATWTPENASIISVEWDANPVPVFDENGDPVYELDENDDPVLDENGEPVQLTKIIATVDENGIIQAVSVGETILTYTMNGLNKAFAKVIVKPAPPVSGLSINRAQLSLEKDKTFDLALTISPVNAEVTAIEWLNDDPAIAEITPNNRSCTVKGLSVGATTVKAIIKTPDGDLEAKCEVEVFFNPLTGLTLLDANNNEISNLKVEIGRTADVRIVYEHESATVYSVTWASSNTAVVSVPANPAGDTKPATVRVTARTPGTSTITVTVNGLDADGNEHSIEKSFDVEVTFVPLSSIEIESNPATGGNTVDLKLILHSGIFDGADEKTPFTTSIEWTSSDEAVATVDKASGKVTAVSEGTVTITATVQGYDNGGNPVTRTARCTITIGKIQVE